MDNTERTGGRQRRWLIIGGFALLGVIVIAAAAVSAWQASVHRSHSADMESRSTTVSLLQDVEEEAGIAATLLQQYVAEGDESRGEEDQRRSPQCGARKARSSEFGAENHGDASHSDDSCSHHHESGTLTV